MTSTTEPQAPGSTPRAQKISYASSHSRLGTLWSRSLPDYSGEYPVGAVDVEFPVEKKRIGHFVHKKVPGNEGGIEIDTVLFTLFYPAQVDGTREKGALWFPRFGPTIDGFLKMAGKESWWLSRLAYVPAFPAVHGLKFPVYQRAPILEPPRTSTTEAGKWPMIIFSHGVGCSRLMYTHICGELASRGYVVAAVEHRDGTGPAATVTNDQGDEKDVEFLRWTDLRWPSLPEVEQPTDDTMLRHDQLDIRLAEIESTLQMMRRLVSEEVTGPGKAQNLLQASRTYDWSTWTDKVEVSDGTVCYAGHSFGGTAMLAVTSDKRFNPASIILMDPAVQRVEPWEGTVKCPVLCINSEEFSDSDDYDRLLEQVLPTCHDERHVLSIAGTTHPSFSDVFLIIPQRIAYWTGLTLAPYQVFVKTMNIIDHFLGGDNDAVSMRWDMFKLGTGITGRPRKPIGAPGDVFLQTE